MKQSQRIFKNALSGGIAGLFGGLLQLGTLVLIARATSVEEFGRYSFIIAFGVFFQLLADAGLTRVLVREMTTRKSDLPHLLGAAVSLIWILSGAALLLIFLVLPFLPFSLEVKVAAGIMGVATLAQFHTAGYNAVLRAHEDNELNHLGFVLHKIAFLLFTVAVLWSGGGLIALAVAHLVAALLLWMLDHAIVSRVYVKVRLVADLALWKRFIMTALPLGGGVMLRQMSMQLDVFVLTWLTTMQTVGLFSGPYRLVMSLKVIEQIISVPLYPMFSRLAQESREQLCIAYGRSVKFFLLIGFPAALVAMGLSGPGIRLALGERYETAIPAMQILSLAILPMFCATLFPYLYAALDEQKRFFKITALGTLLRVGLNIALIPRFGLTGPAVAFLVTEIMTVLVWTLDLGRMKVGFSWNQVIWKPLAGGVVMAVILVPLRSAPVPWILAGVLIALIVYGGVMVLLKPFSVVELRHIAEGARFLRPLLKRWNKNERNR